MKNSLLLIGLGLTASSFGQFVEGGSAHATKATAQSYTLGNGNFIDGSVSVASQVDVYKIGLAAQAPAIYRNQLTTSRRNGATATATTTVRGLSVSAGVINPASDVSTQSFSAVGANSDSLQQFYSFGAATDIYHRVTGTTARDYRVTLSQSVITPTAITGTFAPGNYTFLTNGLDTDGINSNEVDTEIVLYNSSFGIVAQNDDISGTSFVSSITANLAAGTYYFAISDFDVTTHQGPAPSDGNQGGDVMDFAGTVLNSSVFQTGFNQATIDLSFAMTAPSGSQQISGIKSERFGINWYSFEVANPVPEPASMLVLGIGALGIAAKRRRNK
jgi:hypothetical protein